MKIGAIVQARSSSTRLPRKVLKELPYGSGITVLQQVIRRLKRVEMLEVVIIATTVGQEDEEIVRLSEQEGASVFRGSMNDVLERYYLAAKENELDIIVRVTSDCPCIGPELVEPVLEQHIESKADFTSNFVVRTFPHGFDVEVMSFEALEKAHLQADEDFDREHVCSYIFVRRPDLFKIESVEAEPKFSRTDIRITLDTVEDYALLCLIYDMLYSKNEEFTASDVMHLFNEKPWIKYITEKIHHKKLCNTLEEEVAEAVKLLDLQDLKRAKQLLENIELEAAK